MSSSVVFLLVAVGLSVVGTFAVWLHGRPRTPKSAVGHFTRDLRALSMHRGVSEPPSGVTPLPHAGVPPRNPRPARPAQERTRPGP